MEYSYNTQFLLRDGKPWLPMMGEFHYARYPRAEWSRELAKMKACGVDVAATYVFWIHHEAEEGVFDFSGCRDVRAFLLECRAVGLPVWLRIGPWCHGECRHGGFPDWLMEKSHPIRCSDPQYLSLVRRFWQALYAQVDGLMHADGGPVIGIQIENEFGHCGGEGGDAHMDELLALAKEIGFTAPYDTATGWGGAFIGSMLPVMACYCDAPWDRRLSPLPPSPNYLFSPERNDVDVGSDFAFGEHLTFVPENYPYLLAEMGGGIGSTFHRRPVAQPSDTAAMSIVKLGSGANLLGYYMYHGGVNPQDGLNETRESGSWCETSAMSYMPHAPIGDGGQVTELAKELKLLSFFLRSWGEDLAPMPVQFPEEGARRPEDADSPRYALRMLDSRGFAFVNNYQRGVDMPEKVIDIPALGSMHVPSGFYGILPIRLPVGDTVITTAKASPLYLLNGNTPVFYGADDDLPEGAIVLSRRDALDVCLVHQNGREELLICPSPIVENHCFTRRSTVYRTLDGQSCALCVPQDHPSVNYVRTAVNYLCQDFELSFHYDGTPEEVYLQISYEGAMAELYVNGRKAADNLYDGSLWEVALTRLGRPEKAVLRVFALFEGMPCWLEHAPAFTDGHVLKLKHITLENEYRIPLTKE